MYIYLKNSQELQEACQDSLDTVFIEVGNSKVNVYNNFAYPHVKTNEAEVESIMQNEAIAKFFLKAVDVSFPHFSSPRQYGIYRYGKAKAEFSPAKGSDRLKVETSYWEGLPDMIVLIERIWAGVAPDVTYDVKQRPQSPFRMLKNILDIRRLNMIQRFLLALRLTRV